uniref:LRR receptor-like serine/threonine-protein kinase n=1 Tax=Aegilops tauschii subsp. strangulata TaxID=200361 RepID=A0A453JAR5_AEGTS
MERSPSFGAKDRMQKNDDWRGRSLVEVTPHKPGNSLSASVCYPAFPIQQHLSQGHGEIGVREPPSRHHRAPPPAGPRCTNLTRLRMNDNRISGNIHATFCGLTSLHDLDLSNNQLTGELPSCCWEFKLMLAMDLSNNSFSGELPIPTSLGLKLQSLRLANNNFLGSFSIRN